MAIVLISVGLATIIAAVLASHARYPAAHALLPLPVPAVHRATSSPLSTPHSIPDVGQSAQPELMLAHLPVLAKHAVPNVRHVRVYPMRVLLAHPLLIY